MLKKIVVLSALTLLSTSLAQYTSGGRIEGKGGVLFLVDEFRYYKQQRFDGVLDSTDLISNMNKLLKLKGIDYYPAIVPIKSRIYSDQLPNSIQLPPNILSQYDFIMTQFRNSGVRDVNFNQLLLNSDKRLGEFPFFYKEDHHWSSTASPIAAQYLSSLIAKNDDLSKFDVVKSSVSVEPPAVLAKGTLAPDNRPAAAVQTEKYLPTFVKFQGGDLLGDPYFPIVVTGDSFARGEDHDGGFWPYATLISHNLERGVLNYAAENQGAWIPLLNYFKSASYQEAPPVVLVHTFWELFMTDVRLQMPDDYFEQVAPYIMGECKTPSLKLKADGVAETPRSPRLGEYASFSLPNSTPSTATSLELRYATKTTSIKLDSREDATAYYNILLPSNAGPLQGITVKSSAKSSAVKVCALPDIFTDSLTIDGKSLDFAVRNLYNLIFPKNFYNTIDLQTNRWAFGKSASLDFYAKGINPIALNLEAYSPFPNQVITVLLNGRQIAKLPGKGQDFIGRQVFMPAVGRNKLEFVFSQWRTSSTQNNARIDKNDPRDLAVSFTKLQLSSAPLGR